MTVSLATRVAMLVNPEVTKIYPGWWAEENDYGTGVVLTDGLRCLTLFLPDQVEKIANGTAVLLMMDPRLLNKENAR